MSWSEITLWAWFFFVSEWVIRLAMLMVVPFRRTPAAAKGWLLLMLRIYDHQLTARLAAEQKRYFQTPAG